MAEESEAEVTFMFSEGAEPSPFSKQNKKKKTKKKVGVGFAGAFDKICVWTWYSSDTYREINTYIS